MYDEEYSGRSFIFTDDLVELVQERILENRRFTITELRSHFPQIFHSFLHKIVTEYQAADFYDTGMQKLVSWVINVSITNVNMLKNSSTPAVSVPINL